MEEKLKRILSQSKEEISPDFTMKLMDNIYLQKAIQNQKYKPVIPVLFFKLVSLLFVILMVSLLIFTPESNSTNGNYNYISINISSSITSIFESLKKNNVYFIMISMSLIAFSYFLMDLFLQKKFQKTQML